MRNGVRKAVEKGYMRMMIEGDNTIVIKIL